jgi:uncharacterized protein (TIGR02246 family)
MTSVLHDTATTATVDPTAIAAAVLEHLESAWNEADGTAFGAAFLNDAEFVDIRGSHHRGRSAIGHGHQAIFDSIYAGSTVHYQLDVAHLISPGCILAVATATLDAPTGPLQGVNHSRLTVIIAEQGEGWAVAGLHNTLVVKEG